MIDQRLQVRGLFAHAGGTIGIALGITGGVALAVAAGVAVFVGGAFEFVEMIRGMRRRWRRQVQFVANDRNVPALDRAELFGPPVAWRFAHRSAPALR